MVRKIGMLTAIVCALFLAQCSFQKKHLFTTRGLPSSYYDINVSTDTTFVTTGGAYITIKAGSIRTENEHKRVRLEIKEAYNVSDMIKGGLITRTHGEPLMSGGMLFINNPEGDATIIKPISVSIPAPYLRTGMQLYTGVEHNDVIDWTDPQPLPKPELSVRMQRAKEMYDMCASCHKAVGDATGPALAFLAQRRDERWLRSFVRNSPSMIADGDLESVFIYEHYNKTAMTSFPDLTDDDIKMIFEYADYEARDVDPATVPDIMKSLDSCVRFNTRTGRGLHEGVAIGQRVLGASNKDTNMVASSRRPPAQYNVNISKWGWYNVDILMKGFPGFVESELFVTLSDAGISDMNVYLVLPAQNVLLEGGLLKGRAGEYGFYTADGKVTLPGQTKAYIFAIGERAGKLYMGKVSFITTVKNTISLKVAEATRAEVKAAIEQLRLNDGPPDIVYTWNDSVTMDNKYAPGAYKRDTVAISTAEEAEYKYLLPKSCDCKPYYRQASE